MNFHFHKTATRDNQMETNKMIENRKLENYKQFLFISLQICF